jgi:hypothetical protein
MGTNFPSQVKAASLAAASDADEATRTPIRFQLIWSDLQVKLAQAIVEVTASRYMSAIKIICVEIVFVDQERGPYQYSERQKRN